MKSSIWIRIGLISFTLAGSLVVVGLEQPILGLDLRGGVMLLLQANPEDFAKLPTADQARAIDDAVRIIRFRVNETGLAETFVSQAGEDRIWVEIPCPAPPEPCTKPESVRNLIERRGFLEFKKVKKVGGPGEELTPSSPFEDVIFDQDGISYLVPADPLLTGAAIANARAQAGQLGSGPFVVALTFTEEGARQFSDLLTKQGKLQENDRMAIILDGSIQSAPSVSKSIIDAARNGGWRAVKDTTQITGLPTLDEATQLAIVLRSGNLPMRLRTILEESIGPSLGRDSITKGITASIVAGVLVLLFMILYYRLVGFIADLTLGLNLLLLIAVMMLLDATWTLPGIAGLILTIGMGVDSNVLIFERVREELRSGKSVRAAIDFGYERALLTIIDSHVTTLITALILFTFGTGPIKGFATTLSIGIFINLFTALVGTRLAFDLIKEREPRRLSI